MNINEYNNLLLEVAKREQALSRRPVRAPQRSPLSERAIAPDSPSVLLNSYLSDVSDLVYQLQTLFFNSSRNRNAASVPAGDILNSILAKTKDAMVQIGAPEDTNSGRDVAPDEKDLPDLAPEDEPEEPEEEPEESPDEDPEEDPEGEEDPEEDPDEDPEDDEEEPEPKPPPRRKPPFR